MSVTISYKRFGLIPIATTWFNTEPDLTGVRFKGVHSLRQSVPLSSIGQATCIERATQTTSIIDLVQSEEEIWKAFDPKSCRYEIRRIQKKVEKNENIGIFQNMNIDDYVRVANNYIREKKYAKPLRQWLLGEYLRKGVGELLTIHYNEQLLGGNFYIKDFPCRVNLLHSFNNRFSDKSLQKLYAAFMRYLHWHAIRRYKAEGFQWYDTGGVNLDRKSPTYGIAKFKLSLGGFLRQEYNYTFVSSRWVGKCYRTYRTLSAPR